MTTATHDQKKANAIGGDNAIKMLSRLMAKYDTVSITKSGSAFISKATVRMCDETKIEIVYVINAKGA